jgi:hypothetical protein
MVEMALSAVVEEAVTKSSFRNDNNRAEAHHNYRRLTRR